MSHAASPQTLSPQADPSAVSEDGCVAPAAPRVTLVSRPVRLLAATAVCLSLLLAACGGSDDAATDQAGADGAESEDVAGGDDDGTIVEGDAGGVNSTDDGAAEEDTADGNATNGSVDGAEAEPTPAGPVAIDLSALDIDEDRDGLPTGPPEPTEPAGDAEADEPAPQPTPRQVPVDSTPVPLETVVIDDDDRPSDGPVFQLDQNAALACANTEFALDALIAADPDELDRTLGQAAQWAEESSDPGMQEIAEDLASTRDFEAAEQLVISVLQACTTAGYEL